MEVEARYAQLKELAAAIPNFGEPGGFNNSPETLEWLGRLHALINDRSVGLDAMSVSLSADGLGTSLHNRNVITIKNALYRALAAVEFQLPISHRGAFIPVGNAFDAIAAVSKTMGSAKEGILIVDPFLGPKILETYAIQAPEGVQISLLGAKGRIRDGFEPAAHAWVKQFAGRRPLFVRYAPKKALHDRLIIVDKSAVWDISQTFEDLADRSPASLSKAYPDQAKMKIDAYFDLFDEAEVII